MPIVDKQLPLASIYFSDFLVNQDVWNTLSAKLISFYSVQKQVS